MSTETSIIVSAARAVVDEAITAAKKVTQDGRGIDDHQVHAERVAYAATEVAAAEALAAYAREQKDAGRADATTEAMSSVFAAEIAAKLSAAIEAHQDDFGVAPAVLE